MSTFSLTPSPDSETIAVGVVDAIAYFADVRAPVVGWQSVAAPHPEDARALRAAVACVPGLYRGAVPDSRAGDERAGPNSERLTR